jgi:hypothetical protein
MSKSLRNLILGGVCIGGLWLAWYTSPLWLPHDVEKAVREFIEAIQKIGPDKTIISMDGKGNPVNPDQFDKNNPHQFLITTETLAQLEQRLTTVNKRVLIEAPVDASTSKTFDTHFEIPVIGGWINDRIGGPVKIGGTEITTTGTVVLQTGLNFTNSPRVQCSQTVTLVNCKVDNLPPPTVIVASLIRQSDEWKSSAFFAGDPNKINQYQGEMKNALFFSVGLPPINSPPETQSQLAYLLVQTQTRGAEVIRQEITGLLTQIIQQSGKQVPQIQVNVTIPSPDVSHNSLISQLDPYKPFK